MYQYQKGRNVSNLVVLEDAEIFILRQADLAQQML